MMKSFDVDAVRERFPILRKQIYINSCSQGALSVDVRTAYEQYLCDWDEQGAPWEYWVERAETVRKSIANLIHVAADEIAVTTSVSAGVSALASALSFSGKRNKVISTAFEFPTVGQVWHAQESRGAQVIHAPAFGSSIPLETFERLIDDQTLIVSLSHVCFRNGAKLDIPAIVHLAHRRGALVLADVYQSVGTTPLDVRQLGVDFMVGGTLKYLLASAGLAFLYVRADLISGLQPTAMGWFSQQDIFAMDATTNKPSLSARRFESGTPPIPNIYAALAGLNLVQTLGVESIEHHVQTLTKALIEGALSAGYNLVTPVQPQQHGALITIKSNDVHQLVHRLAAQGVIVSSRDNNLRISPHFYNTLGDIEATLAALKINRDLLV